MKYSLVLILILFSSFAYSDEKPILVSIKWAGKDCTIKAYNLSKEVVQMHSEKVSFVKKPREDNPDFTLGMLFGGVCPQAVYKGENNYLIYLISRDPRSGGRIFTIDVSTEPYQLVSVRPEPGRR